MLRISDDLKAGILKRRQQQWLKQQIATARMNFPATCANLSDDELGERIMSLHADATKLGIQLDANKQRHVAIALHLDDDSYYLSQSWAVTIFAWDTDENVKLAACEQNIAQKYKDSL